MGDVEQYSHGAELVRLQQYRKVSPYTIPRLLNNMAAGHVSMEHKLQGPNHCVSTACATGTHSVGDALRFIQMGDADVMVAGATEAVVTPACMSMFCRARALSTANDRPLEASRPFDAARDGFVIAEGAACLVLEEFEHAKQRGARMYAEVLGYGMAGDAYHITMPSPDGGGAILAMQRALKSARVAPADIHYVNAHATSTAAGDALEIRALHTVFGDRALLVSSTKGATGHMLGAAGAIEAVFTVLAVAKGIAPPTLNLLSSEVDSPFNFIPGVAQPADISFAMSNSFGFGGTNASLVFGRLR